MYSKYLAIHIQAATATLYKQSPILYRPIYSSKEIPFTMDQEYK